MQVEMGCLGEGLERAQLVQSPWGKRLPAKPEEQQGGHWGGRRGTGREEAEERRGGGRGAEGGMRPLVREDAAIWSEMEPREVSRDGKKQGSDSNQIPPWGPGRPLRGQGGQGGSNHRAAVVSGAGRLWVPCRWAGQEGHRRSFGAHLA